MVSGEKWLGSRMAVGMVALVSVMAVTAGAWGQGKTKSKAKKAPQEEKKAAIQTMATTDDGRRVALRVDGSWEFAADVTDELLAEATGESSQPAEKKPAAGDEYDFRKARWGMSKKKVKATEKGKPAFEEGNLLGYKASVAGKDALAGYIFAGDVLVRSAYLFDIKHTNDTDYITDYKELKKLLTEKYGKPSRDEVIWKDDLYRDKPSKWGMAVATGGLIYFAEWKTGRTEVFLSLMGDNFDIKLKVEYSSNELQKIEEEEKKKKNLSDL